MMSRIGPRDTEPEMVVRRAVHALGLRYRLHRRDLPGKPDLVFPKFRAAVFVHGCYWHRHAGCRLAYAPKSRADFWLPKFARTQERDREVLVSLHERGWRTAIVWECTTRKQDAAPLAEALREWLHGDQSHFEVT